MEELTQDGAQLARTMLMSAAQLAESLARVQAQRAWMAQSWSAAQAAHAQQQIAAERDAARLIFRPLADERYWRDAPQLDRVVQAYMAAAPWSEHDPDAGAAVRLIKQHAESCWGNVVASEMRGRDDRDTEVAVLPTELVSRPAASIGPVPDDSAAARLQSAPGTTRTLTSSLRYGRRDGAACQEPPKSRPLGSAAGRNPREP